MQEFINNFHFLHPNILLLIPLIMALGVVCHRIKYQNLDFSQYKKLASPKNLKEILVVNNQSKNQKTSLWLILFLSFIILSLAKPRWHFKEVEAYYSDKNLVILLDSSNSMSVKDLLPNRFERAKQEINDIINEFPEARIGLLAFTEIPHIISPLTKDHSALKANLSALNINDFSIQGSNINNALKTAFNYFKKIPSEDKFILLATDGGFMEEINSDIIAELKKAKIKLYIYAIGTEIGGPIFEDGKILEYQGEKIISKLDFTHLEKLVKSSSGGISTINYDNQDLEQFSSYLNKYSSSSKQNSKVKKWSEGFYIFLLPALFFLFKYIKHILLSLILLIGFIPTQNASANIFLNQNQNAKKSYQNRDYKSAQENFSSNYNKGVAAYRNNDFKNSAKYFKESGNQNSLFNLGNSYFKQSDFKQAIKSYEDHLQNNPDDKKAKHNLDLAKKMLEKQKKEQKSQKDQKKDQKDKQDQKDQQKDQQNKDKKEQNKNQQNKGQQKGEQKQDSGDKDKKEKPKPNPDDNIFNLIETDPRNLMKKKIENKDMREGKKHKQQQNYKPW